MPVDIKVNYKIILYSLDFTNAKELVEGTDIRYTDPVDYFNVNSKLHWKFLQESVEKYKDNWTKTIREFKESLIKAISEGRIKLLEGIDITKNVKIITGFENSLEEFSNSIGFRISQSSEFDREYSNGLITTKKIKDFLCENQIIEVRVDRGFTENWITEYIGFIGTISYSKSYGTVPDIDITVYGINKFFGLSNVVQKQAIYNKMFDEGIEITTPGVPVYQDNWNNLNTGQIFSTIMEDVLCLKAVNVDSKLEEIKKKLDENNDELRKIRTKLDDINKEIAPLKSKISLTLDEEEQLSKKERVIEEYKTKIRELEETISGSKEKKIEGLTTEYNKRLEEIRTKLEKIRFEFNVDRLKSIKDFRSSFLLLYAFYLVRQLDDVKFSDDSKANEEIKKTLAILEHGEHKTYNEMVARGFETFYTQMAKPIDILRTVREVAFYDIFENRKGQIICRPQKYNELEIDLPENGNIPEGDFVIKKEDILDEAYHRNDIDLATRCDAKFMYPFFGEVGMIGGWYTDANILFKYGLRVREPTSNPNVINRWLASIYSAMILYRQNAFTRQINISVPNTRTYEIGRLYYIELNDDSEKDKFVGYLNSIETTFGYGKVSTNILKFIYVRRVERKAVKEFLQTAKDNDYDMIYSIYKEKILSQSNVNRLELLNKEKNKKDRISEAKKFLERNIDKDVIYFSIIPTILDVIYEVESDSRKKQTEIEESKPVLSSETLSQIAINKDRLEIAKELDDYYAFSLPRPTTEKSGYTKHKIKIFDIMFDYRPIVIDDNQIKELGFSDFKEFSDSSYLKTKFRVGIFDSPAAGNASFVTQSLINGLTLIDLSFKFYNWRIRKWMESFGEEVTGRLDKSYTYFNFDNTNLIFSNSWFEIDSQEWLIEERRVRRFWAPKGWIYLRGPYAEKKIFELEGGEYFAEIKENSIYFLTKDEQGKPKYLQDKNGVEVAFNRIKDTIRFYTDSLIFDLEKLFDIGSIVWGFRTPEENRQIIYTNKKETSKDSADAHFKGNAVDIQFLNFRMIDNGHINLKPKFFTDFTKLLSMLNGERLLGKYIFDRFPKNNVFTRDDIAWARYDYYYHIEGVEKK